MTLAFVPVTYVVEKFDKRVSQQFFDEHEELLLPH